MSCYFINYCYKNTIKLITFDPYYLNFLHLCYFCQLSNFHQLSVTFLKSTWLPFLSFFQDLIPHFIPLPVSLICYPQMAPIENWDYFTLFIPFWSSNSFLFKISFLVFISHLIITYRSTLYQEAVSHHNFFRMLLFCLDFSNSMICKAWSFAGISSTTTLCPVNLVVPFLLQAKYALKFVIFSDPRNVYAKCL